MKLHRIAVATAALSMAGAAIAAGNQATTTTTPSSSDRSSAASQRAGQQAGTASSAEQSNPALVRSVQQALKQKGYDTGAIDGQFGASTEKALRDFQQAQGLPPSGNLDEQTLSALGVEQNQGAMRSSQGAQSTMQSPASTNSTQGLAGSTRSSGPMGNQSYKPQ